MLAPAPPAFSQPVFSKREILQILGGVQLGIFLGAVDQTIVATALPAIADELNGIQHISWTVSAYLLTATASTPIYGKLSDLYGRRALFTTAIVIFLIGSILCGMASSMGMLIGARALQGLGGGGLISLAQTIVADIIPARERGRYQAYMMISWISATVGGPMLGGFFVDALSWRWVFWINLPVGLLALGIAQVTLRRLAGRRKGARHQIDLLGAALLMAAIVALLLVTSWGGIELAWTSPTILALAAGGVGLLAVFAVQELRAPEPILPPRLFANSIFVVANALTFACSMAQVGAIIFLPLYLQIVHGVSASSSGVLLAPLMLGQQGGAFFAGQMMRRLNRYRIFPLVGLPLSAATFIAFTFMSAGTSMLLYSVGMVVLGIGFGLCGPPLLIAVQNSVEMRDMGAATSANAFFRSMGGSFGVALIGSILLAGLSQAPEAGGASGADVLHGGAAMIAALPEAGRRLVVAAFGESFRLVFVTGAIITGASILLATVLRELPLRGHATPAAPLAEP
jgi:EmrB/QacA subfamily drug resistance transporter